MQIEQVQESSDLMTRIAYATRRLRRNANISRTLLSERSGVDKQILTALETNNLVDVDVITLQAIAAGIGIKLSTLISAIETN